MKHELDAEQNLHWFGPWILGFLLFFSFGITTTLAQESEVYLSSSQALERIDTIIRETRNLDGRDPSELLQLVREGLKLAQSNEAFVSKLELLRNGSKIVEAAGDFKLAEKFLELALELAREQKLPSEEISILTLHGELLARNLDYESAIRYLEAAQQLCEKIGDRSLLVSITGRIAIYYAMNGQRDQAEIIAKQALKSAQMQKSESAIGHSYFVSAIVQLISADIYREGTAEYIQLAVQDLQSGNDSGNGYPPAPSGAQEAIEKAIHHFDSANDDEGKAGCYLLKGDIARSLRNISLALENYRKASDLYASSGNHTFPTNLSVGFAVVEALQHKYDEASSRIDSTIDLVKGSVDVPWLYLLQAEIAIQDYNDAEAKMSLNEGIQIAQSLNNHFQLSALYRHLSQIQMNLGEYGEGIASLELAHSHALKIAEISTERKIAEQRNLNRNLEQTSQNQSDQGYGKIKDELDSYIFYFKISWMLGLALLLLSIAMLGMRIAFQNRTHKQLQQADYEIAELKVSLNKAINDQNTIIKNFAQEMRTPMSGIVGSIPLLHDTTMTPLQENCINIIDVSSRAILSLINDISDLSKLDSGEFKLARDPADLVQITEAVAQLFVSDSEQTQVELICDMPSDPIPLVHGDANRIQQILMTLVGRSFQTTFKGYVLVKLKSLIPDSEREFDVQITVEDSGTGVEEKAIDKVFEISPTLTNINSLRRPASMLGMTICKKLVEAMRGSIEIKAKTSGGLKVVVVLPFRLEGGETTWNVRSPYERFPKKQVLVVDSSESARKLLTKHLRTWGIGVESAIDVESTTSILEKPHEVDAIVLDVEASDTDSTVLDRISRFRKNQKTANTPIILLTPNADFHLSTELKRQKYIHQLPKPVPVEELHNRIRQAIVYKSPLTQSYASLTPAHKPVEDTASLIHTDPNTGFHFIPYILPFRSNTKLNEKLRILLVEDNAVNRKVTSLMLKKIGYDIDTASSGKEAIQKAKKGNYDVILMDKVMPGMDGLETTLNIRKLAEIEQPIIIALTASASMEDEIACRKATMDNFLAKPVQFEKMKAALAFASGVLEQQHQMHSETS